MTRVLVPERARAPRSQALDRCVRNAASKVQVPDAFAALVLTHVLEAIAAEVARGETVVIPGFGMFTSRWFRRAGDHGHGVPVFVPARGLRNEIRAGLISDPATSRRIARYRRRHSSGGTPGRAGARTFTAMDKLRRDLYARNGGRIDFD